MTTNGLHVPVATPASAPPIKVNSFVLRLASHKDILRRKHGLTAAEVSICMHLAAGYSVQTIASLQGVSKNTVRTQISTIMSRTYTARQAELVSLLACIALDGK